MSDKPRDFADMLRDRQSGAYTPQPDNTADTHRFMPLNEMLEKIARLEKEPKKKPVPEAASEVYLPPPISTEDIGMSPPSQTPSGAHKPRMGHPGRR